MRTLTKIFAITLTIASIAAAGNAAARQPTAFQQAQAERRAEVQREQAERRAVVKERQAAWKASRRPANQQVDAVDVDPFGTIDRRSPQEIWVAEQFRQRVTRRPPNAHPRWADQPEWSGANRGPSPFGRPSTSY
jgi:hypothetical protein